jgi:acyl carrier protein
MTNVEFNSSPSSAAAAAIPSIDTIVSDLLAMIRLQTKSDGKGWGPETTMHDTGIDSFDFVELVYELEGKYGIDLNFNANTAEDLKTVADVAALIQSRTAAKGLTP